MDMTDPRREAILIRRPDESGFDDRTSDVVECVAGADYTYLTFQPAKGSPKKYRYSTRKILVLSNPERQRLGDRDCVSVRGQFVQGVTEVWRFDGPGQTWWRVFSLNGGHETHQMCVQDEFAIVPAAELPPAAYDVLNYWHDVVSHLETKDPLRPLYEKFRTVPQGSVLDLYLRGAAPDASADPGELIFPFSTNLSQREALRKGLTHRISVIDGPPGPGKTETILTLVANIIRTPGKTVGVVSSNNAAVRNVRDKLTAEGLGHVAADLGNNEVKVNFFTGDHPGNTEVQRKAGRTPVPRPAAGQISDLDERVQHAQTTARELATRRQELAAFKLERRHFGQHIGSHDLPPLPALAILQRPSVRILEFLAETASVPANEGPFQRLFRRVRGRFRYGPTKHIDPYDTDVVLRLQAAFYDKRIAELEQQVLQLERQSDQNHAPGLEGDLRRLSRQALAASLHERYATGGSQSYSVGSYRRHFSAFAHDYPVILSTCHSLPGSIPDGFLLDYLIIDEASQVDLLVAGSALSRARNLIVVGDLQQLPHIPKPDAAQRARPSPAASYDYERHSILSSIIERFGTGLPRTMLREHYRCDPAIIDFCNKKFYGGQLIPFTTSDPGNRPLVVVRTAQGNHMRQHAGGRTNQREADVIAEEVLRKFCSDTDPEDIGVVTPYRLQVDKVAAAIVNTIQADTVHKFQGRAKDVIIMSTVLDETRNGRFGVQFVDNPHLVNVAVSRAVKRFVLVTNYDMLPASRHLRDLVRFIQYQDPEHGVFDSSVLSVFDLLYKEYSAVLGPLAARLHTTSKFASENIVWTLLLDILAEDAHTHLAVAQQVVLRNLLPDLSRLTPRQADYVRNRATMDFVIYNRITNVPVLAVEVDGFAFHEADPLQKVRDGLKDAICSAHSIPLLRLPTTGSGEEPLIRNRLTAVDI
jgi:hypothetical protein